MSTLQTRNTYFLLVTFTLCAHVSSEWRIIGPISPKGICGKYVYDKTHRPKSRPTTTLPPPEPPPLTQAVMIGRYIDYITYKGSVCEIRIDSKNTHYYAYTCSCATLAYNLAKLTTYPGAIMNACHVSHLRREKRHYIVSSHVMCGNLAFYGEEDTFISQYDQWNIKIHSQLIVNITIWHFRSVSFGNAFLNCEYVGRLNLMQTHTMQWRPVYTKLLHMCGVMLPQVIFSSGNRILIRYEGKGSYDPSSPFEYFLSYQPVVGSYIKLKSTQQKRFLSLGDDQDPHTVPLNLDNAVTGESIGKKWWSVRSVLSFPEITEINLSCQAMEDLRKASVYVVIYDAPFHPLHLDPEGYWSSYHLDTLRCGSTGNDRIYQSTLGDMTIYLVKGREDIAFGANVSYRNDLCVGRYCKISTANISKESVTHFVLSSGNETSQKRIRMSIDTGAFGYISLSDISVAFEGFTDFPCVYGGIFIFEGQHMSLVASLCTSWISQLWDDAIVYEDGSRRLHFGQNPVLLVLKSYRAKSRGYIRGVASVSPCMGVIFTHVRENEIYKMPNSGDVIKVIKGGPSYYRLTVSKHSSDCWVLQVFGTDDYKIGYAGNLYNVLFSIWQSLFKKRLPYLTIGISGKRTFRLFSRELMVHNELQGIRRCPVRSGEFRISFPYDDVKQTLWLRTTPPLADYRLSYRCQFHFSVAVILSYWDVNLRQCQPPIEMKYYLLDAHSPRFVHPPVPVAPCGSLRLKAIIQRYDYQKFRLKHHVTSFIKPYTDAFCCILRLRIFAENEFYQSIAQFFLDRHWSKDHFSWSFLWMRSGWNGWRELHVSEFNRSSSVIDLLGREWRANGLFGEVGFSFFISEMMFSFSQEKSLMNITFNFTRLEITIIEMVRPTSTM